MSDARRLGLLPWVVVQCGLPHSKQTTATGGEATYYERRNGKIRLCMAAHPKLGLPYGKMPRLLLAHLVVEFRRNLHNRTFEEARTVDLGKSYSAFLKKIGVSHDGRNSGGRNGSLTRFRNQTKRLITCDITSWEARYDSRPWDDGEWERNAVADKSRLWWSTNDPNVECLFESYVRLSHVFAKACETAVPVDLDTISQLRSTFAIDLYVWLSYRAGKLHENGDPPAEIPWRLLMDQFGHGYKRERDFKRRFRQHLKTVIQHHPVGVNHTKWPDGIIVHPAPPHIQRRRR